MGKDGDSGKHRREQTCSVCHGAGGKWHFKNGTGPARKEWRDCGTCKGKGKL